MPQTDPEGVGGFYQLRSVSSRQPQLAPDCAISSRQQVKSDLPHAYAVFATLSLENF